MDTLTLINNVEAFHKTVEILVRNSDKEQWSFGEHRYPSDFHNVTNIRVDNNVIILTFHKEASLEVTLQEFEDTLQGILSKV